MPNLFAASQQMQRRHTDQIPTAVLGEEPAFDLLDLGPNGSAKCYSSGIGDVEADDSAQVGHRTTGGLQRIATHQRRCGDDTRQPKCC